VITSQPNRIAPVARAMKLWARFGFAEPTDLVLEDLAFALGVVVIEGRLDSAEARLIRNRDKGLIRVREDISEAGRKRFAIGHEMGHWELHAGVSQVFSCTSEDMLAGYKGSAHEIEANLFAAELLMPQSLFRRRAGANDPSVPVLRDLATYFQTSLTATALRFVETADEKYAMVVVEDGRVRWWRASEAFGGFWLDPKTVVQPDTVVGSVLNGEPLPTRAEKVDGEAWLGSKAASIAESLFEVAVPLTSYGQIISMLWPA
jgi:Zn-dependent peptidase ImmA (M78 family)